MFRTLDLITVRIFLTFLLSLGTSLASAGDVDSCAVLKPELRVKAGLLLRKYREQNKETYSDRVLLLLAPGKKPEITALKLPEGTQGAHLSKETLAAVKKAAGDKVIVWNDYGRAVDLLPYESAEEMSSSFDPRKDCSPSSKTLRNLCDSCCVVDFSKFTSGVTALYGDTAKKCALMKKVARRTDLSQEEEEEYNQAKKSLKLAFHTATGEKRDLAIDKESTIVLPKKDPVLEIGDSMPADRSKVPAEVDGAL